MKRADESENCENEGNVTKGWKGEKRLGWQGKKASLRGI